MVDSHTHLYLEEYYPDGGIEATVRAIEAGVDRLMLPNIDLESSGPLIRLHQKFPDNTYVAAGLHPTEVGKEWKAELKEILLIFSDTRLSAIGEVGIDLHWDHSNFKEQMDAFGEQIQLAVEEDLPVIVHSRDAFQETFHIVKAFESEQPRFVFHSYPYGCREAEKILESFPSALFGFNGVITFKNASTTREAAGFVGIDRILSETDSPFLTPVPHRGKTNQSCWIPLIVKAISGATGVSFEEAEKTIDTTFREKFLNIPHPPG